MYQKNPKLNWKDQFTTSDSASKFHNKVGLIFQSDPYFKRYKCYQEVCVKDICPGYVYPGHRFDWYIPKLNIVIELHGRQHYHMVNFGSIGYDEAMQNFQNGLERDSNKQIAAIQAHYRYVEIPYTEYPKLTAIRLREYILGADT